jgi:2-oxoisovalerate dehydrogenase E2 component (dihydrolipoyl transacylase)
MGAYIIKTPDIGEGIAEVELVAWYVKPGDHIKEDQTIADLMTEKATVEVPSPTAGIVVSLGGAVGSVIAVGAELVRLEVKGEGNFKEAQVTAGSSTPPINSSPPPNENSSHVRGQVQHATAAEPKVEQASPTPSTPVKATEPGNSAFFGATRKQGEKPIASPVVRKLAWDLGVELQFVQGTGPVGRIRQEDVEAYVRRAGQPVNSFANGLTERNDEQAIPVIGLRRKIAQKMQDSKRRIPHFSYVEEIDVTELEQARARLNSKYAQSRGKLTLLPLLSRAIAKAIQEFPQMNARFDDEAGVVTRYGAVHLGIATQTGAGLMVPVVQHAEARDIWSIASEIGRLAEVARSGKGTREELSGSTITISSLGPLGGIASTPVINHPEVAIIGVNRLIDRPVVRNGSIVIRQVMNLSSSFDHRVIDGMDAAQFIQAVRAYLESPALLFTE